MYGGDLRDRTADLLAARVGSIISFRILKCSGMALYQGF
jgi:hypothetical protein